MRETWYQNVVLCLSLPLCVNGGLLGRQYGNSSSATATTVETITASTIYETLDLVEASPTTLSSSSSIDSSTTTVTEVGSTVYETLSVEPVPASSTTLKTVTTTSSFVGLTNPIYTPPLTTDSHADTATTETIDLTSTTVTTTLSWEIFTDTLDETSTTVTMTFSNRLDYTYSDPPYTPCTSDCTSFTAPPNTYTPGSFTETLVYPYPALSTTLTITRTFEDQAFPTGTEAPIDGNECQYYGIDCPATNVPTPTDSVEVLLQSLYNAEITAEISQCSRTIVSSAALAQSSLATFTETIVGPSTVYEGYNDHGSMQSTVIPYTTSYVTTFTSWVSRPAYDQVGCCGECNLQYSSVDVYYFPPANGPSCIYDSLYSNLLSLATQTGPITARDLQKRPASILNGSTLVNSNGFTFTSPSIYVGFSGVVGNDLCGQVGGNHGAFTLAFAPGDLFTVSAELGQPARTTGTFDTNAVTCGSRPIIALPDELLSYDPAWSTCIGNDWQGNDPPYALAPQQVLASTTPAAPIYTTGASPSSVPSPFPVQTQTSIFQPIPEPSMGPIPYPSQSVDPADPPQSMDPSISLPASSPASVSADPSIQSTPAQTYPPQNVPTQVLSSTAAADPIPSAGSSPLIIQTYITTTSGNQIQTVPILTVVNMPPGNVSPSSTTTGGLGGIIISAFNGPASAPSPSTTASPQSFPAQITIGSQIATILNPSSINYGGSIIVAGSAPVVVNGYTVSVLPSGNGIDLGSTTIALPAQPASTIVTVGSQLVTMLNPSAVAIAGTTLTVGAPAITVGGQVITVAPSGTLLVGTSLFVLPVTPQITQAIATVAGQTIVGGPSGVVVQGSTLIPGGPTLTINNTPVYINSAGLIVGTSTVPLPLTLQPTQIIATIAGQTVVAGPTGVVVGGSTLVAGGPTVTISGTPVYVNSAGLVIGASTVPTPFRTPVSSVATAYPSIIAIGPSETLTLGGATSTINGTPVYYGTGGLVIGTSTVPLPVATDPAGPNSSTPFGLGTPFTGAAVRLGTYGSRVLSMFMIFAVRAVVTM